jgi:predicted restriction endonuclease
VRRGQPAFRRRLLAAYEGTCCISGWAPEAVLEAAHIQEHSKAGLNSMANGLLLRSDLHALFDEG